jgi:hypothetical protein
MEGWEQSMGFSGGKSYQIYFKAYDKTSIA